MPARTVQTGITGEWVICLDDANLRRAMSTRNVSTYKQLANLANLSERTVQRAFSEDQVPRTVASKLARALDVSPHIICRWALR